jgi:hypothetical protein
LQKLQQNINDYYTKSDVEQLLVTYSQAIRLLNLDTQSTKETIDNILDPLYSVFQLSHLHEDSVRPEISIFKHYRDGQYVMMSVHSSLFKEIS